MAELPFRTVAEGLRFPEGPIALPDGSVLISDDEAGVLYRVTGIKVVGLENTIKRLTTNVFHRVEGPASLGQHARFIHR